MQHPTLIDAAKECLASPSIYQDAKGDAQKTAFVQFFCNKDGIVARIKTKISEQKAALAKANQDKKENEEEERTMRSNYRGNEINPLGEIISAKNDQYIDNEVRDAEYAVNGWTTALEVLQG